MGWPLAEGGLAMDEVYKARAAHDAIARRASSVAAVFARLDEHVPLPLVLLGLAPLGIWAASRR